MDPLTSQPNGGVDLLVSAEAGVPVLRLAGELDVSTCDLVREAVLALLDTEQRAVIDLDQVSFVDFRGLDPLVECRQMAVEKGWAFELRNLPPSMTKLLELFPELVDGLGVASGDEGPSSDR